MHLPRTKPRLGILLQLFVSNLLLWEGVATTPDCTTKDGGCELQDLLHHAGMLSEKVRDISLDMYDDFFNYNTSSNTLDEFVGWYSKHEEDLGEARKSCHTSSLNPPVIPEDVKNVSNRTFLRLIIMMVGAWKEPLHHLIAEASGMPEVPEQTLSKAKAIQEYNDKLLLDIKGIFIKIHPRGKPKDDYPVWKELSALHSAIKHTRFLAIYKVAFCLGTDAYKIANYVKFLKCRILQKTDC